MAQVNALFSGSRAREAEVLDVPMRRSRWSLWPAISLMAGLAACVPLGMSLPSDDPPPEPSGSQIKATVGWLTTQRADAAVAAPEGSIAIEVVHIGGPHAAAAGSTLPGR